MKDNRRLLEFFASHPPEEIPGEPCHKCGGSKKLLDIQGLHRVLGELIAAGAGSDTVRVRVILSDAMTSDTSDPCDLYEVGALDSAVMGKSDGSVVSGFFISVSRGTLTGKFGQGLTR